MFWPIDVHASHSITSFYYLVRYEAQVETPITLGGDTDVPQNYLPYHYYRLSEITES